MIDKPERHAIIAGVGQSRIGRRLFRTDLDLTCEAALAAIADAGLAPEDIDGIAAYPGPIGGPPGFAGPGIYEVQECLGNDLRWHLSGAEGPAQISPIIHAMLAIAAYQKAGGPTEKTSDGVERILGRPPRTLTEFARDYVDHFRG